MIFVEASRAEYGDTGPREVETLEATQELKEDLYGAFQVSLATASTRQEQLFRTFDLVEQGMAACYLVRHGIPQIACPEKSLARQFASNNPAKDLPVMAGRQMAEQGQER
jgi:hypothetical protein